MNISFDHGGQSDTKGQAGVHMAAAFFSLYVAIIFLISAIAFPGFRPYKGEEAENAEYYV